MPVLAGPAPDTEPPAEPVVPAAYVRTRVASPWSRSRVGRTWTRTAVQRT